MKDQPGGQLGQRESLDTGDSLLPDPGSSLLLPMWLRPWA